MKREIRFRAWYYDGKNLDSGEMQYNVSVHNGYAFVVDRGIKRWSNCVKIMQYTGLTDCNGQGIYEGDLVKTPHGTGKVSDRLGCWFIENQKELGYFPSHELEITGNIYEGKEKSNG